MIARCEDCGASRCADVFDELLALEFQRIEPFGRLHGVTVAAFGVQHPSRFDRRVREAQWALLWAFHTGGIDAAEQLQGARRRSAARGRGDPTVARLQAASPPLPDTIGCGGTIADLTGSDGRLDPDGHTDRVRQWVTSIVDTSPTSSP